MTENPSVPARHEDRHSHIHIGLRLLWQDQWVPVEARGWSDEGFNFYFSSEITHPHLELQRQTLPFEGRIVWASEDASDDVLQSMLLNALIYRQAKKMQADTTLQQRLLRLIRVAGLLEQKRAVLATLGKRLSDADMAALIARRRQRLPLYHYGVQVDSDVWRATVRKAISLSSAVFALEKWAESFSST